MLGLGSAGAQAGSASWFSGVALGKLGPQDTTGIWFAASDFHGSRVIEVSEMAQVSGQ